MATGTWQSFPDHIEAHWDFTKSLMRVKCTPHYRVCLEGVVLNAKKNDFDKLQVALAYVEPSEFLAAGHAALQNCVETAGQDWVVNEKEQRMDNGYPMIFLTIGGKEPLPILYGGVHYTSDSLPLERGMAIRVACSVGTTTKPNTKKTPAEINFPLWPSAITILSHVPSALAVVTAPDFPPDNAAEEEAAPPAKKRARKA